MKIFKGQYDLSSVKPRVWLTVKDMLMNVINSVPFKCPYYADSDITSVSNFAKYVIKSISEASPQLALEKIGWWCEGGTKAGNT